MRGGKKRAEGGQTKSGKTAPSQLLLPIFPQAVLRNVIVPTNPFSLCVYTCFIY